MTRTGQPAKEAAGSDFSDATHDRVMAAVDRMEYVPNRLNSAFHSVQASTLVGMCVPRLTFGRFGHVLDGVDRALTRLGYQAKFGCKNLVAEEEKAWLRQVVSWRPAWVILSGRSHTPVAVELRHNAVMPVVEIWDLTTSPIDRSVGFSHFDC